MLHTLVDSRLAVPFPAPWQITRARLLAALDEASAAAPLTLVSAGPGAGKTVLLAQWARHRAARRASTPPGAPPVQVIDDAHLLPDLPGLIDSAARSRRHLVVATRHDPPLPLHRYRLAGQMRELRMPDLAMTADEIRGLIAAHQVTLPLVALNALAARTEGWAAGVRLAAMQMAGHADPARVADELSFGPGGIGEYFSAEVLAHLPDAQRRLLIETSFLDEVTAPLAEAVTGLDGAGEMLAELARGNWFVIALDPAGTRFRYHRMFGEALRCLLRRDSVRSLPELAARAARRLAADGDFERSLRWSASAGDPDLTSAILMHGGLADAFANHRDIPGADLPRPAAAGGPPPDADTARAVSVAGLVGGMRSGDAHAVDDAAARLLASEPRDARLRGSVLLALAGTRFWHGAFSAGAHEDVDTLLEKALNCAQRCGDVRLQADVLGMIACASSYRSRPGHVDDARLRAHCLLRGHPGLRTPPALRLAVAIRCVQQADLAGASRALRHALVPRAVGADPGLEAALGLWRASVLALSGQPHEAQVLLEETAGGRRPDRLWPDLLLVHRDVLLGEIDTSLGRPHAALKQLERHRGGRLAALADVSRGRAYLALDDLDAARQSVHGVLSATRPHLSRYVLVESMLLDARIAERVRDTPRALEMITNALDIADGDLVLPFAHARSSLGDLLSRHPAVAGRWPGPPSGGPWNTDGQATARRARGLQVQLTEREKSILAYLATSMTASEIADELYLSVNTVKTHLAAIYRKLGTGGRRAAVRRARELELL